MMKKYFISLACLFSFYSCKLEKNININKDTTPLSSYATVTTKEDLEALFYKHFKFSEFEFDESLINFKKQPKIVTILFGHESDSLTFTLERKGLEHFKNLPYIVKVDAVAKKIPVGIIFYYASENRCRSISVYASRSEINNIGVKK